MELTYKLGCYSNMFTYIVELLVLADFQLVSLASFDNNRSNLKLINFMPINYSALSIRPFYVKLFAIMTAVQKKIALLYRL